MIWRCRTRTFDLTRRTLVMGVLNVTPDSFSDGGRWCEPSRAVERALQMVEEGADIIDIGGESTRPGAEPVSAAEELRRVMPVIEALDGRMEALISIDTMKAEVARRAVEAGATIINDVSALRADPAIAEVAAECQAGLVLMHMQGEPRTMQAAPRYDDVVREIGEFFVERAAFAGERGIDAEQLAFDPGIGFGKTLEHNLEILRRMEELVAGGRPLLVGASRKAFLRRLIEAETGRPPAPDEPEVIHATAAAVAVAVMRGARIVRVHDVGIMATVTRTIEALK